MTHSESIKFQKFIYRADLRQNPDQFYVFGDNIWRTGLGGQAKEMRGERNAIGVVTKRAPGMNAADFFADRPEEFIAVMKDLDRVANLIRRGHTVVFPTDGIGTGLSQLPQRSPRINQVILEWMELMCMRTGAKNEWPSLITS